MTEKIEINSVIMSEKIG